MRGTIQRWGNSLALRIPKSFATDARLDDGSAVEISLTRGALVIRPAAPAEPTLDALLARVTPENLHTPVETGPAVGRETG